jgi:Zn-finger nucleic acid-binding protein
MSTQPIQENLKEEGYSNEEKYFYELNRELINKQKIQLDLVRKNKVEMNCPRCDQKLVESMEGGIRHLQCTLCSGIFLEGNDLRFLMTGEQPARLVQKIKKLFLPREDYRLF